jgi:hypothetical protein
MADIRASLVSNSRETCFFRNWPLCRNHALSNSLDRKGMVSAHIPIIRLLGTWPICNAVLHARCGNFPREFRLSGKQMSSEDNFRVADHPVKTSAVRAIGIVFLGP